MGGAPDIIYINQDNKHLASEWANYSPEFIDWALSSPVRFHNLRLYYDSYRGSDGQGPVRGWLLSWDWLPGVDEETKELIRQRDARRHPSRQLPTDGPEDFNGIMRRQ